MENHSACFLRCLFKRPWWQVHVVEERTNQTERRKPTYSSGRNGIWHWWEWGRGRKVESQKQGWNFFPTYWTDNNTGTIKDIFSYRLVGISISNVSMSIMCNPHLLFMYKKEGVNGRGRTTGRNTTSLPVFLSVPFFQPPQWQHPTHNRKQVTKRPCLAHGHQTSLLPLRWGLQQPLWHPGLDISPDPKAPEEKQRREVTCYCTCCGFLWYASWQ